MNPLRAKLVEDLNALDKYPWTGHSVLLGNKKNSFVPEIPPFNAEDKYLAEKTVDDVLRHFGENFKDARRKYRCFVEKGIKHGHRTDLQGGGLVRSAGGDTSVLSPKDKENRELSDDRILGSGHFVEDVLRKAEEKFESMTRKRMSLEELIAFVANSTGTSIEDLKSTSRKRKLAHARAVIAYTAIRNLGYKGTEVAEVLSLSPTTVSQNAEKGKIFLDRNEDLKVELQIT